MQIPGRNPGAPSIWVNSRQARRMLIMRQKRLTRILKMDKKSVKIPGSL